MDSATQETSGCANGTGEPPIKYKLPHHLWLPKSPKAKTVESPYHLKLDILRNNESRGDCPSKLFVSCFQSY